MSINLELLNQQILKSNLINVLLLQITKRSNHNTTRSRNDITSIFLINASIPSGMLICATKNIHIIHDALINLLHHDSGRKLSQLLVIINHIRGINQSLIEFFHILNCIYLSGKSFLQSRKNTNQDYLCITVHFTNDICQYKSSTRSRAATGTRYDKNYFLIENIFSSITAENIHNGILQKYLSCLTLLTSPFLITNQEMRNRLGNRLKIFLTTIDSKNGNLQLISRQSSHLRPSVTNTNNRYIQHFYLPPTSLCYDIR